MPRHIATTTTVDRSGMEEFVRSRHHGVLATVRIDGSPQMSPVTMGMDAEGRVVVSTYPQRVKVMNLRKNGAASICVLSDDFDGAWIRLDGAAEVIDLPESVEPLVEYFRSISGEHSDWDEYRQAMVDQGKSIIRITIDTWGPIARGGFPPELTDS